MLFDKSNLGAAMPELSCVQVPEVFAEALAENASEDAISKVFGVIYHIEHCTSCMRTLELRDQYEVALRRFPRGSLGPIAVRSGGLTGTEIHFPRRN